MYPEVEQISKLLPKLENLIFESDKFVLEGDKLIYTENDCLYTISLPSSLKKASFLSQSI